MIDDTEFHTVEIRLKTQLIWSQRFPTLESAQQVIGSSETFMIDGEASAYLLGPDRRARAAFMIAGTQAQDIVIRAHGDLMGLRDIAAAHASAAHRSMKAAFDRLYPGVDSGPAVAEFDSTYACWKLRCARAAFWG